VDLGRRLRLLGVRAGGLTRERAAEPARGAAGARRGERAAPAPEASLFGDDER